MKDIAKRGGLVVAVIQGERPGSPFDCKIRDLTESWLRFKYQGDVLLGHDLDELLNRACTAKYKFCLVLSPGTIVLHAWNPWLFAQLEDWARATEFLVAGELEVLEATSYGMCAHNLLVNLKNYALCGRPAFGAPVTDDVEIAHPKLAEANACRDTSAAVLLPSGETVRSSPKLSGWHIVSVSLQQGLPVRALPVEIHGALVSIAPSNAQQEEEWRALLGDGIHSRDLDSDVLSDGQLAFLRGVQVQIRNSRRGVFVWNFESYEDVTPAASRRAPLTSIYSVAAGLKTNWILAVHGYDEKTRIVYFDYSEHALEFKRELHTSWDGIDYPSFLRRILAQDTSNETFYQLWGGRSRETVDWAMADQLWADEIKRWGGEQTIREAWSRIKSLDTEFISCNLLSESDLLLERIRRETGAVIWWSNLFFSFFSNWYHTQQERAALFRKWARQLAERNPQLLIYGKDHMNGDVSGLTAKELEQKYMPGVGESR